MSWQLATKAVYKALTNEDEYPIRSLNRFKTDPRVKTGPRFDFREAWAVFSFGAELQRSRGHWFVFHARSRFYAIEAVSVREAKRIVEQYRLIRVPQFLVVHQRQEGACEGRETGAPQAARADGPGMPGVDSAQQLGEVRRGLLRVFKRATIRRDIVTPLFRRPVESRRI
jgi:hypothetical protein